MSFVMLTAYSSAYCLTCSYGWCLQAEDPSFSWTPEYTCLCLLVLGYNIVYVGVVMFAGFLVVVYRYKLFFLLPGEWFDIIDALTSLLWPPYVMGQTIKFVSCCFSFLLFFLACSQLSEIGSLPYFHTWCGLSANLECKSEMCCKRLSENTGRKNSPSGHHHTTMSGCIFATKARIDNRKKTSISPPCVLTILRTSSH